MRGLCICREFAFALIWSSAAPASCVRGSVLRLISWRRIFGRVGAGCRDSENGPPVVHLERKQRRQSHCSVWARPRLPTRNLQRRLSRILRRVPGALSNRNAAPLQAGDAELAAVQPGLSPNLRFGRLRPQPLTWRAGAGYEQLRRIQRLGSLT